MIKISTYNIYVKKVCHYNEWSLKINLFTKVFIKRCVLIFGRAQRQVQNAGHRSQVTGQVTGHRAQVTENAVKTVKTLH